MRIAVFGATGATGRHVVAQALAAGHRVTALARTPAGLADRHDRLRVVAGDVGCAACVEEVVRDQDVVISVLGASAPGPVSVCTDGARAILAAMERHGVRRLLALSAHGAAESRDRSLYALAVWATQAAKMRDKERMEELIRASGVEWTIVRPPALTNGPRTGTYRTGTAVPIKLTSKISRADLAEFLLREAAAPVFVRQLPRIAA